MHTILQSTSGELKIGPDQPFVMIGEKINPTGRKRLAAALQESDLAYICDLARVQIDWGADMLDINIGVPGLDEAAMIPKVIEAVIAVADVPLCIDSGNPDVLKAGLSAAPGKPLVNSVSGEETRLANVLPLVKERSAAVIGLTMDDNGIPATPKGRLAVAEKILERAGRLGIPSEDVIIDPLVLAVGSDSNAAMLTLQTIELLRRELGVNINVGASNVSFGLPDRMTVNQAFLALAIQAGATCGITDPLKLGMTVRAADLLLGRDDHASRFIKYFRAAGKLQKNEGG